MKTGGFCHAPTARGEWPYSRDATGTRQGTDVRYARESNGFTGVLPRRWVGERAFSWLLQSRHLSKDYERLPETEEAFIDAAMRRLMLRRLAQAL